MGRVAQMLDAAGDLLLAHGYRRVTVEDVARRAGVGKGTVYLHFASKLELFAGVLVRESVEVTAELLAALRADPAEAALDATMRRTFLAVQHRPLTRALLAGDVEVLGAIATDTKTGLEVVTDKSEFSREHFALLHRQGLLADDPATTPDLYYRLGAASIGFFVDHLVPAGAGMDVTARADALAAVVRAGFTPPGEPDPAALAAAAPGLAALYERTLDHLTAALPEEP
ncbi:TetR/AcrR family transcriptional regulator [Actinomycetospora lemnae]|uniref:Helix-turn-helix domain containing protein n=1 Tax=Actinomycetospora lemnae TaxID=3019891 RepID=A0ABT5SWE4_9PSEU|nr:TetR/AcrR family transcriptional regulator [Actinomycetospora sp. DW7H6]MDD7967181.1 helix-turn-helix domain containing protein [Actinomycetospora sp. DW7H6]